MTIYLFIISDTLLSRVPGPNSANGRASASGVGGHWFQSRPRHNKGVKNDTGYPHDGRADKDSYPHNRHNQYIMLIMVIV